MKKRLSKKERLVAICEGIYGGNRSAMSRGLEISIPTIQAWFERETYKPCEIYEKLPQLNCHWLLTGEGDMLNKTEDLQAMNNTLAEKVMELDEKVREQEMEIKYWCDKCVEQDEEKVVHLTISMKGNKLSVTTDRE